MVLFDIDDTLYSELQFIRSSYDDISRRLGVDITEEMLAVRRRWEDVFEYVKVHYAPQLSADEIAQYYWLHLTHLDIYPHALQLLHYLKEHGVRIGIISDGRSRTQRNKLAMLGLNAFVTDPDIVISEEVGHMKPYVDNFRYFADRYPDEHFTYIGDNLERDFIAPNALGWDSFCLLDAGKNIHPQDFSLPAANQPRHVVERLDACIPLLNP